MAVVRSSHVLLQSFVTPEVGSESTDTHTHKIHPFYYCMNTNVCTITTGHLSFCLFCVENHHRIKYNRELGEVVAQSFKHNSLSNLFRQLHKSLIL